MTISILVAKLVAIIYVGIGLGAVSGQMEPKKIIKSLKDSPGLTLVAGIFTIILGFLLVQSHNVWVADWTILITIIGWAILIKGFLFLMIPKSFLAISEKFARTERWMGIIAILIGLIFGYLGFLA